MSLSLRVLPWPWLIIILIAVCWGAAILYRGDRRLVPDRAGAVLVALRIALVSALAVLLAGPVGVRREMIREPGEVLVFVDASRSFAAVDPPGSLPGGEETARGLGAPGGAPRRELAARALDRGLRAGLESRFRVSWYGLDGDAIPFAPAPPGEDSMLASIPAADGEETDLGSPVAREVLRRPRGTVAGVVLLTDGHHGARGDPLDTARLLGSLGTPIIGIGIGAASRPPDAAIDEVEAAGKVFEGDEIEAQVAISFQGLHGGETGVEVREGDALLREARVTISEGSGTARVPLAFPAGTPGRKRFTFRLGELPGERTGENNLKDLWIEVAGGKIRALLLDGYPRWEERYLRSGWERDPRVDLRAFLVTPFPDRRLPEGFPRSKEALFDHDAIVLGDVDPGVFARDELSLLRDYVVSRGGTLVVIAGERSMPYRWRSTPLAEALPVVLLDPPPVEGLGASIARGGLPLDLTPAGEGSGIARLVPGKERSAELWGLLPRPLWLCPIAGVKPGAEVLVTVAEEAASRLPGGSLLGASPGAGVDAARRTALERFLGDRGAVVVTGPSGAGKALWMGMDATWRWRYRMGDELHRKFWGQVLRWAASERLEAGDAHVRLGTDSVLYEPWARVRIDALVLGSAGKPLEEGIVDAVITRPRDGAEARVRLLPIERSGGRYRASAVIEDIGLPLPPGAAAPVEHRVRLEVPSIAGYSELSSRAQASFAVEPPLDREARADSVDRRLLEEYCAASGGRFFTLEERDEAARALPARDRMLERTTEVDPWDHPLVLAPLLLGLLAAEWILRKKRELI